MPLVVSRAGFEADWHPELLFAVLSLGLVYWQATGPLRHRFGDGAPVPPERRFLFLAGTAMLYVAQGSPIEILSNRYLLSAHMLQAVLLLFWAPPLLLAGTPSWLLGPVLALPRLRAAVRLLTRPAVALALFGGVFSLYLLPGPLDGALRDPWLYLLEHLLSLASAFLLWWPVASPLPALPPLPQERQVVYTFAIQGSMAVVFAVLTMFAHRPFYPAFARTAPLLGVPALADQQLAGIVMFLGCMPPLGVASGLALAAWLNRCPY